MGKFDFLYNCKGEPRTIGDLIEYAFADKEKRKMLDSVPPYCQACKLLYKCRDETRGYKCRQGCLQINAREYIPPICFDCILKNICRDELNDYEFKHNKCLLHKHIYR